MSKFGFDCKFTHWFLNRAVFLSQPGADQLDDASFPVSKKASGFLATETDPG